MASLVTTYSSDHRGRVRLTAIVILVALSGCATTTIDTTPKPAFAVSRQFRPAVYSTIGIVVEDQTGRLGSRHPVLREIEDEVIHAAITQGFTVAARSDIDRIISDRGESGLSRQGTTEYAFAGRANALGIRALVIVSVTEIRQEERASSFGRRSSTAPYRIDAGLSMRLIDTELAQVVHVGTYRFYTVVGDRDQAAAVLPRAARTLLTALPARHSVPVPAPPDSASRAVRATRSGEFSPNIHNRLAIYIEDRTQRLDQVEGALRQVEDEFMQAALRNGYAVSARSDLGSIQREIEFQNSGAVDEVVARAGRALGVPAVLIVTVDRASTTHGQWLDTVSKTALSFEAAISARMISTERARVLWLARHEGRRNGIYRTDLLTLISGLATEVASTLPRR